MCVCGVMGVGMGPLLKVCPINKCVCLCASAYTETTLSPPVMKVSSVFVETEHPTEQLYDHFMVLKFVVLMS